MSIAKSTTVDDVHSRWRCDPLQLPGDDTGNVTLTTAITVSNSKIASVTCPALPTGGLLPTQSITCTGSYTITQADIDAGQVQNTASATSGTTTSPPVTHTLTGTQSPAMSVVKSTISTTFTAVGDVIPYSFLVTNTGNVTLTNAITVADTKIASVTCPALPSGGLTPTQSITCTGSYTITQADLDAGRVINRARASTTLNGKPVNSPSVRHELTGTKSPAMSIAKSTTSTTFTAVGDVIPYSFLVTNTGNVTLTTAITVSDSKIASVTCPALPTGGLLPTQSITCTGSYTITQADLDAGQVQNTASATSGTTTSPPVTHTLTGTQNGSMSASKSLVGSQATDNGNGTFTAQFRVIIENTGNVSLSGANAADNYAAGLPTGARIVSATVSSVSSNKRGTLSTGNAAFDGAANANLLVSSGESLAVGERIRIEFSITFDPGANAPGNAFNNTIIASASTPGGGRLTAPPAEVGVPFESRPKINLVKSVSGSLEFLGSGAYRVTYVLKAKNTGNVTVNLTRVDDDLAAAFNRGTSQVIAVQPPVWIDGPSGLGGTLNSAFDGNALGRGQTNVIGTPFELKRDQIVTIQIQVDFRPNSEPGPFLNSAIAEATAGSTSVTDVSQNSTNPDDPGATPTPIAIDPSGIVYDSLTGLPVPGARAELTDAAGNPLPAACLAPGQQPQTTGPDGAYRFDIQIGASASCPISETEYRIRITPPAGYSFRSVIIPVEPATYDATGCPAPAQLNAPFCQIVTPATPDLTGATTYFLNFRIGNGDPHISHNHIPLDPPIAAGDLVVTKRSTVRTASVGDMVDYVIGIRNNTSRNVSGVTIVDNLPPGFSYVKGSARLVASVPGPAVRTVDPVQTGARLAWRIDASNPSPFNQIPAGGEMLLRLKLIVGAGLKAGDYVNRAHVEDATGARISNVGQAIVSLVPDPTLECSELIGKVFNDKNRNGYQDNGEPGIPSVRLATATGIQITTDEYGRYHLPCAVVADLRRGTNFILKADTRTLPTGYEMTTENPRVIRMRQGRMGKINFGAALPPTIEVHVSSSARTLNSDVVGAVRATLEALSQRIERGKVAVRVVYWTNEIAHASTASRLVSLATMVEKAWVGKSSQIHISDMSLEAMPGTLRGSPMQVRYEGDTVFGSGHVAPTGVATPVVLVKFDSAPVDRRLNISSDVTGFAGSLTVKFLGYWNYDSWIERAEVRVFDTNDGVQGRPRMIVPLNTKRHGELAVLPEMPKEIKYVLRVYDRLGNFDETLPKTEVLVAKKATERVVEETKGDNSPFGYASSRFGAAMQTSAALLTGYGRNSIAIKNIKLGSGTITVHARNMPKASKLHALGREIEADAGGKAVIEKLVFDGRHDVDAAVSVDGRVVYQLLKRGEIKANDFFLVAIGDVTVGKQVVRTVGQSRETEKIFDSRGALYFKGKVRGDILITAMADVHDGDLKELFGPINGRDPRRFLRRLDPDKFYPVYGDDSTSIEDAPTSGRLFVKVEHDNSYIMWGNFRSSFNDTEYGRSARAMTGAKANIHLGGQTSHGEPVTKIVGFAANPESQSARDELRGTGGSVYYLRRSDLVLGSEEVRIEIRDRRSGIVLQSRQLARGEDYDLDYLQGRVVLNKPLNSTADDDSIFGTGGPQGHPVVLVVQYEYIADPSETRELMYGARVARWINDHILVGGTLLRESGGRSSSTPFELYGLDVTLRYTPTTYIKAEIAETRGVSQSTWYSIDGGFSFDQKLIAGPNTRARGVSIDAVVNLADVVDRPVDGKVIAYYRDREPGFAALGYETLYGTVQYGVRAEAKLTPDSKFVLRADSTEEDTGRTQRRVESTYSRFVTNNVEVVGGVAADETTGYGKRAEVGSKVIYHFDKTHNVYVLGSTTVATWDGGRDVHRGGVGAEWQLTEKLSLKGQVTTGTGGIGALAAVKYRRVDGEEIYIGYELPDRTSIGTAAGNLIIGARKRYSDTLSVFGEEKVVQGLSGITGLTHAYGVDYSPAKGWQIRSAIELGKVETLDRTALALHLGYKNNWFKGGIGAEYRLDESLDKGTRETWAGRVGGLWKITEELRLQMKVNGLVSDSNAEALGSYDARFLEATIGTAYRPIWNDRLNVLFKYAFLYDMPPLQQFNGSSLGVADFKQQSHILSIDALYDVNKWLTIGGKYGFKIGEQTGSIVSDDWFRSSAQLITVGADVHLPFEWDLFVEGRVLDLPEADQTLKGVVVGAYKHIGVNAKIGVGYNFGHFSGDLANPTKDENGWFVNVISKW